MGSAVTVHQVLLLARQLSPAEKAQLVNELIPDASCAPGVTTDTASKGISTSLDDEYERGYTQIPEDIADIEALLPHLSLPAEQWE